MVCKGSHPGDIVLRPFDYAVRASRHQFALEHRYEQGFLLEGSRVYDDELMMDVLVITLDGVQVVLLLRTEHRIERSLEYRSVRFLCQG